MTTHDAPSLKHRSPLRIATLLCGVNAVAFGIRVSSLGLVWPAMRTQFELPQDAIGALLMVETSGAIVGTTLFGFLAARFSLISILLSGGAIVSAGVSFYVFAPTWELLVLGSFAAGYGLGNLCSGMNAYLAEKESAKVLTWVHAFFGVGATAAPFLVSLVLWMGGNWRVVFGVFLLLLILETFGLWFTRDSWELGIKPTAGEHVQPVSARRLLGRPITWFLILLCLFYCGLEHTPGVWCFTLFTESRGIEPETARHWMALYWGVFTVGRFVLAPLVEIFGITRSIKAGSAGAIVASVVLWTAPYPELNPVSLLLLGVSLATIYPTIIAQTPRWVGRRYAPYAIGFMSASTAIGSASLPALAGVIIVGATLEALGAFLFILSLVVAVLLFAAVQAGHDNADQVGQLKS